VVVMGQQLGESDRFVSDWNCDNDDDDWTIVLCVILVVVGWWW
jgi:hypothetical protein